MDEIPVTAFAAAIRESGTLEIAYQITNLSGHL
jgi:hypothetical protein